LIDMPLSPQLAAWLVDKGYDAVHATAIGLSTAPDTEIMEVARQEHRTIVTADLDYPRLLAIARSTEPSLILFRGGSWSEADVRARMAMVLANLETTDIVGSIIVVERDRVRRRRLPL
jgi:predicted nuclease of predicted toxin-antitoxin system